MFAINQKLKKSKAGK